MQFGTPFRQVLPVVFFIAERLSVLDHSFWGVHAGQLEDQRFI